MVEEMTPLLDRVNATRRLRFTEEWELLDPEEILKGWGWLKHIRETYWKPCANTYLLYTKEEWDYALIGDYGKDMPEVRDFKRQLAKLNEHVTSNTRPFFFKIAMVNLKLKEIRNGS